MAVDLCIESYLAVGHSVDALWLGPVRQVLHGFGRRGRLLVRPVEYPTARQVAAELPIEQAAAVWLVDVCGVNYADASRQMGCTRDEVACHVAAGRIQIRERIGR